MPHAFSLHIRRLVCHHATTVDKEISIIFVEDIAADADAVDRSLHKHGLKFKLRRVETRDQFLQALSAHSPDIILSDHGLPTFDGFAALAVAHEKCPDVPFIFVSNALNWEMQIDKLVPGVTDFVQKRHLNNLAPTIHRALFHAELLRSAKAQTGEHKESVQKLLALLSEYEPKQGHIPICANCKNMRDSNNVWQKPEAFLHEKLGLDFTHGICPDCIRKLYGR